MKITFERLMWALTAILFVLKLTGAVDCSWIWVFAPIWIFWVPFMIGFSVLFFGIFVLGIIWMVLEINDAIRR